MTLPTKLRYELRRLGIYGFGVFLLIVIIWLFKIDVISILTTLLLIVLASFSKIYKQFTGKLSLGFELITPVTVIFAYKFGILFALVSSIIMLLASSFIAGKIDFPSTVCEVVTYLILSMLTYVFSGVPFVPLALVMMVLRDIIMVPMGILILGRNPIHMIIVFATNVFLNILFIMWLGNFFVGVL